MFNEVILIDFGTFNIVYGERCPDCFLGIRVFWSKAYESDHDLLGDHGSSERDDFDVILVIL